MSKRKKGEKRGKIDGVEMQEFIIGVCFKISHFC